MRHQLYELLFITFLFQLDILYYVFLSIFSQIHVRLKCFIFSVHKTLTLKKKVIIYHFMSPKYLLFVNKSSTNNDLRI